MNQRPKLTDINIRTQLRPGDIGYVTYLHGKLYAKEYNYNINFEAYVAAGLQEFFMNYDPNRSRVWVAEHQQKIVGFILLMDRDDSAQLRHFIILPEYRGIGLGKTLLDLYITFLKESGYRSSYLWTTKELHEAAHLYTKYGFKLVEEKKSVRFGKPVIEQKYELIIS